MNMGLTAPIHPYKRSGVWGMQQPFRKVIDDIRALPGLLHWDWDAATS